MRGTLRLGVVFFLAAWTFWGCGGSGNLLKKVPPTINTVKSTDKYTKKVAVVLAETPRTPVGQGAGRLYFKTLARAIAGEDDRIRLVTPGDGEFPGFMAQLARQAAADPSAPALSKDAREAGYQGIVVAAVRDIRVSTIRTGLFWFRKTRYLINFDVTADLYDPHSAAKLVGGVVESKVRIGEDVYEDYTSGLVSTIEALDEEIADAAEDLGEEIGEALSDLAWKVTVVGTDGDRVFLPAGSGAGLSEGDRMAVFEGRRLLTGQLGERFIAPGYQVGTVDITAVVEQTAEARSSTPGKINVGDIAVPVR